MSETFWLGCVSAASGLLGALIGILGSLVAAKRAARAEERRQKRVLGLEIGRAKFEHTVELARRLAELHGLRIMEIVSDGRLSAEEMGRRIAESVAFSKQVNTAVGEAQKGEE